MENQQQQNSIDRMEINILALVDNGGFWFGQHVLLDDKLAFLEAVRFAFLVPENRVALTRRMLNAIFQILKEENSLELVTTSYHLLNEIDKSFPRLLIPEVEVSNPTTPSKVTKLFKGEEVWSPFLFHTGEGDAERNSRACLDPSGFHLLIRDLVKVVGEENSEELETKSLRNMFLLQYLVSFLKGDSAPRISMYKENLSWNLLKESLLNMLLGSGTISYKILVKDCLSILIKICDTPYNLDHGSGLSEAASRNLSKYNNYGIASSFLEVKTSTCIALQNFLLMAQELDASMKEADLLGLTSRSDGLRLPVSKITQDVLVYTCRKDLLIPFLQVLKDPKWKLNLVLQYFQKYMSKPSGLTRQASGPLEDATFDRILKFFQDTNKGKSMVKKIGTEVVQSLLAHAFQASYEMLASQPPAEAISCSNDVGVDSLPKLCQGLISAFTNLKKINGDMRHLSFAQEALFTAATILSAKQ